MIKRDYKRAEASYREAASIAEEADDGRIEFTALAALGNLFASRRNYTDALKVFERALPLGPSTANPKAESHLYERVGLVYLGLGEYYQAIGPFERAVAMLRALGEHSCEAHALRNLSETYFKLGNRQEASKRLREAMQISLQLMPGWESVNVDELFDDSGPLWIFRLTSLFMPLNKRFQGNQGLPKVGKKALVAVSSRLKLS